MGRYKTVVETETVLVLGLVGFVAAMVGIEYTAPGTAHLGPLSALAFAAVPSMLWLGYFYLQDRNEPEPKALVAGVFILGAFVAAPLANFVGGLIPIACADLDPLSLHRVLKNILLIGMVQEMAKYVVVRYSIYRHHEFDEPMDGIVYMMAAGIGFATAQNYDHLTGLGGNVVLSQAAMNTVINTLAHACFAGALGYALGLARFSKAPPIVRRAKLFCGLCVAAVLNGVFTALENRVTLAGVTSSAAWRGLAWAAGFSAVVLFAVSILITRHLAISPFRPGAAKGDAMTTAPGSHVFHRHDLIVLLGGAVLVALGSLALGGASAELPYTSFEREGLTVRYPQSTKWFPPTGADYPAIIGSAQCAPDPRVACAGRPTARIAVRVYDDALRLGEVQSGKDHDAEYGDRAKRIITAESPRDIGGKAWRCTRFAYVPVAATSESVAIECSFVNDKKLYVVTLAGPEAYVSLLEPEVINKLVVK